MKRTREEQLQHWREETARNHSKTEVARRAAERAAEKLWAMDNVVSRDPCTFCGTRADHGCKHNRIAA